MDLVIETPDSIIGIEIKAGHTLHTKRHRGLEVLGELVKKCKPCKKWFVFTGEREQVLAEKVRVLTSGFARNARK